MTGRSNRHGDRLNPAVAKGPTVVGCEMNARRHEERMAVLSSECARDGQAIADGDAFDDGPSFNNTETFGRLR